MTNLRIVKLNNGEFERLAPGETVPPEQGGTGIEAYTIGDLLYAAGANQLTPLPNIATGNVLLSGGIASPPSYGKVNLTQHITGILGAANGGTGLGSYSAGYFISAATTSTLQQRSPAQVLTDIGGAAAVHAHSGSAITTGTIDPERLGTGTPSSSTYLRGDGTWAIIVGGGASGMSSIGITPANGITGVSSGGLDPRLTITLGDITPSSIDVSGDGVIAGTLTVEGNNTMGSTVGTVTTYGAIGGFTTFTASTASTLPNQAIAIIDGSVYRSGEFRIQAYDSTAGKFHTATILVVHNGVIANFTEFGDIDLGGRCGDYSVDYAGGFFRLLVTPDTANVTAYKIVANLTKL